MYFISGVWFYETKRNHPMLEVSSQGTTSIKNELRYSRFMGWFQMPVSENSKPFGEMRDDVGKSFLVDVSITDITLSFTKRYHDERETVLYYDFHKKEDGIWEGRYMGPGVRGIARCVLMEVSDTNFLTPPQ